jgi:hypothetical protein
MEMPLHGKETIGMRVIGSTIFQWTRSACLVLENLGLRYPCVLVVLMGQTA